MLDRFAASASAAFAFAFAGFAKPAFAAGSFAADSFAAGSLAVADLADFAVDPAADSADPVAEAVVLARPAEEFAVNHPGFAGWGWPYATAVSSDPAVGLDHPADSADRAVLLDCLAGNWYVAWQAVVAFVDSVEPAAVSTDAVVQADAGATGPAVAACQDCFAATAAFAAADSGPACQPVACQPCRRSPALALAFEPSDAVCAQAYAVA